MKKVVHWFVAFAMLFVIFVPLTACGCAEDTPKVSGRYSATAEGMGEVRVTIDFRNGVIEAVEIDAPEETESIGGRAIPTLIEQLKNANNPEIDGVTGATWTSNAVREAAREIFDDADIVYKR